MKKFIYKYKKVIKLSLMAAIPLLLFFISYGCQDNEIQSSSQMNYSGEQIFRGIFFFQGDFPNHIEALKAEREKSEITMAANKNVQEFKLDFSNEIVKEIKSLDPAFFNKFKEQMESKNYYAVELAMANATKMIKAGGYKSKYSGFFKLSDALESKKADLTNEEFMAIDTRTPEGMAKYKSLIKDKYDINVDDDDYKIACAPYSGFCVVYIAAAAVSIAAVLYSGAAVISYVVYNKVEFWGGVSSENSIGRNVVIEELAIKLGRSKGVLVSS